MYPVKRVSSCVVVAACVILAAAGSVRQAGSQTAPAASPSLDYDFFKTKVQAVFLAKRAGHARCVVCHTFNNAAFRLVPLSPGSTTWIGMAFTVCGRRECRSTARRTNNIFAPFGAILGW